MNLLVGPHGEGSGIGLSLFRPVMCQPLDEDLLKEILLDHSCWPPAIPKIVSCMKASGRYDCRITEVVYKQSRSLNGQLVRVGIHTQFEDCPESRRIEKYGFSDTISKRPK